MDGFFTFLFNFENVNNILRPEWIKIYDFNILDEKIIGGLKSNYEVLSEFIGFIYNKSHPASVPRTTAMETPKLTDEGNFIINESDKEKKKVKAVTIPEPFNLTKQKPKKFLEPIKMNNKLEIKEIPLELFNKTSLLKIEEEKKERKQIISEVI